MAAAVAGDAVVELRAPPALPAVEVRYEDLSLTVRVSDAAASRTMPTVGETLLGAATALPRALARALSRGGDAAAAPATREVRVLDNVSGVIRPGTMTLLLGAPGAGKSSFMKALTGRLSNAKALSGSVRYAGLAPPALAAAGLSLGQLVQCAFIALAAPARCARNYDPNDPKTQPYAPRNP